MSKTRINKSGHTYNLHGCQQSPRFINRINKVCQRINKLCQRIAQNVDSGLVQNQQTLSFLNKLQTGSLYNLHVCQILSLLSKFGPKYNLEFGSCLEYCSTFHFPYYHKCPYGNVKKFLFLGLSTQITPPPPHRQPHGTVMTFFTFTFTTLDPPPFIKA